jgi:signal transduction histidine kinase
MSVNYYPKSSKCLDRGLAKLDINSFFNLQAEQLTDRSPFCFTRIVFCADPQQQHQEIIKYADGIKHFHRDFIKYLQSEKWLADYPESFTVDRVILADPQLLSYLCVWGYTNNQPEYIQVIVDRPLSLELQRYLQNCARLLHQYRELYFQWNLQQAESKLLQEIIQNISHQLRNSLSLISLCAKNLWFSLKDNSVRDRAQLICDGIENLDTRLTELIDCSQSQQPRLMSVDLHKIVEKSLDNLQPLIQQKKLKIITSKIPTFITVDRLQIEQVFDNLLSNAVHFSPEAGTVSCKWQIFDREVLISIVDRGVGLSPEDLQKVFNPFYSRREGGTGLGLTISRKIVLGHQGSLWAENLESGGAKFSVILPCKI